MEFYHIVNRGVDKRHVFMDTSDRLRFVHNLYEFNDTASSVHNNYFFPRSSVGNVSTDTHKRDLLVNLHGFCLMPNHYHLLVSPRVNNGIAQFMKKVNMGYSKYFNEKYSRTGALWQGKYRSTQIERDAHFGYVLFYIHFNPLDLTKHKWREGGVMNAGDAEEYLQSYRWSSHGDYLEVRDSKTKSFPSVTHREVFQDYFNEGGGYKKQVKSLLKDLSKFDSQNVMFE